MSEESELEKLQKRVNALETDLADVKARCKLNEPEVTATVTVESPETMKAEATVKEVEVSVMSGDLETPEEETEETEQAEPTGSEEEATESDTEE